MNDGTEALRNVSLFADLDEDDLRRLCEGVARVELPAGEVLFAEGDEGAHAYVIESGELDIVKQSGPREVLLACRLAGEVIGEMALLDAAPRMASARARRDTVLIAIPKESMDELIQTSASAARALFGVLLNRWRETEAKLRQSERMAQIGTLTAGLAHELNNPAAAVRRGSSQLRDALADRDTKLAALRKRGVDPDDTRVASLLTSQPGAAATLSALDRADLEADVEDVLVRVGVDEPWIVAPELVAAGVDVAAIDAAATAFGTEETSLILETAAAVSATATLLHEVEEGASRLSAIVGALKSYSYLDQAPVQEIDIHTGIDDTLLILRARLTDIGIVRDYGDDVPLVTAHANELNQVWTNLIANAADALIDAGTPDPTITLRTRASKDLVTVVVEDNGPGIPEDKQARVFDAFFTTKPPGSGTGLGLDITYGIVVHQHRGDITLQSEPGRTIFRVELPIAYAGSEQ